MLYFFFTVTAPRIAEQPAAGYVKIGEHFLIYTSEFTSPKEFEFRIKENVHQHFLRCGYGESFKGVNRSFSCKCMQNDAVPGAPELDKLFFVSLR